MSATAQNGASSVEKPAVLIVGGLGFIGRYLALHIHNHSLASEVRLVDKLLPELAWLSPEFSEACSRDKFVQADASREQSLPKIFDRADGREFDYVFNCGGETRYSQEDEVYKARSYTLSMTIGREAAKRGIKCFVECSTGMVYKPDSVPRKETDRTKPWLKLAKWKLQAEEDLAKVDGLKLVILRMAHVYGPYESKFLATALCMARVYKELGSEMKWLWDKDLRTNTVHVDDVARALWTAAEWYRGKTGLGGSSSGAGAGGAMRPAPIFNLVDHGNTSQGTLATLIGDYFHIPTGFHGTVVSSFARLNLDSVVDDVNDDTLDPWADMQEKAGLKHGPISPFVEKELLKDTDLSLDGSKFEKETGFAYQRDRLGATEVNEVIESFKRMNWWP